jgi:hypothetical protein
MGHTSNWISSSKSAPASCATIVPDPRRVMSGPGVSFIRAISFAGSLQQRCVLPTDAIERPGKYVLRRLVHTLGHLRHRFCRFGRRPPSRHQFVRHAAEYERVLSLGVLLRKLAHFRIVRTLVSPAVIAVGIGEVAVHRNAIEHAYFAHGAPRGLVAWRPSQRSRFSSSRLIALIGRAALAFRVLVSNR